MIAPIAFKSMTVSEAARADAEFSRLVDRGSEALTEVLGESLSEVDVRWDVVPDDRGRPLIELTLGDWNSEGSTRIAPAEFDDNHTYWMRLYSLWSSLLRAQSKVRMREMKEAVRRLDALDTREE